MWGPRGPCECSSFLVSQASCSIQLPRLLGLMSDNIWPLPLLITSYTLLISYTNRWINEKKCMWPDLEDPLKNHLHISLCARFFLYFCYFFLWYDGNNSYWILFFLTSSCFFGGFLKNARSIDLCKLWETFKPPNYFSSSIVLSSTQIFSGLKRFLIFRIIGVALTHWYCRSLT